MTNFIVDQVVDNGDNSLTITGHTDDNTSYTTNADRKSDLPKNEADQTTYCETMLDSCLPSLQPVLYQNPDYVPMANEIDDSPVE